MKVNDIMAHHAPHCHMDIGEFTAGILDIGRLEYCTFLFLEISMAFGREDFWILYGMGCWDQPLGSDHRQPCCTVLNHSSLHQILAPVP